MCLKSINENGLWIKNKDNNLQQTQANRKNQHKEYDGFVSNPFFKSIYKTFNGKKPPL